MKRIWNPLRNDRTRRSNMACAEPGLYFVLALADDALPAFLDRSVWREPINRCFRACPNFCVNSFPANLCFRKRPTAKI